MARDLLTRYADLKAVLKKTSLVKGGHRVADYTLLAGTDSVTVHREFGFEYALDVRSVFFNPRLGYERMRVASHVGAGERVLVPFCGVGPFAVPIAARGAQVVAVEINKGACRFLLENASRNKVADKIHAIRGDALCLGQMVRGTFDRAVIPTPYGVDQALNDILPLIRSGGRVHFYTFKKRDQISLLVKELERAGLHVDLIRRCGHVAPEVSRWVFDLTKL